MIRTTTATGVTAQSVGVAGDRVTSVGTNLNTMFNTIAGDLKTGGGG